MRLAIKVRCSNNKFFRVNPVYVFLDSGTMNELEVRSLDYRIMEYQPIALL